MEKIHLLPAHEIHRLFTEGKLSAEEIVKAFLQRIDALNGQVGAFLAVYHERALNKARELDAKKKAGGKLGRLGGVPIALKDNIHLKGELTTCASKFLTNFRAPFNATVTRLIEEEDGIIIGKTNLDEFAMGSTTENSALLKTRNPWNLACVPGGSSGGSSAAVAARFCPIALGSDTGGSVRQPASFCGVAGFKPTYGRVSRYGLVAFGSSLDQIGPFTHDMQDMALIMEILGRHCEHDSTSLDKPVEKIDLSQGVQGLKIGVPWAFLGNLNADSLEKFKTGIKVLESLGAKIIDVDLNILKYSIATYYIVASAEASTNLARFDGIRYGVRSKQAKTLDEVYDLSKEDGFGPEVKRRILLGTYVLSSGYQDAYYKQAQRVRRLTLDQFNKVFAQCDLIAMPVTPTPAFEFGSKKDPLTLYLEDIFTIPANMAGLPAISVPNGLSKEGMPEGMQFLGKQKNDAGVIAAANAFNKATKYLENDIPKL